MRQASPQQAAITQILMTAVGHIEAGRFADAESALAAEGGIALKTPVGRNVLGDIQLKTGRLREALKSFDQALKQAPTFPEAHCNRGVVLQEMGRLAEALRAEDRALKHRAGYPMASFNRGNILRDLGRLDEALAAFDLALRGRPDFPQALLNRGLTRIALDQPMQALPDFQAALRHDPKNVAALAGRASAERAMNLLGDAMATVTQALAIDPDDPETLLMQHDLYGANEQYEEALAAVARLLANDPDHVQGRTARAWTLVQMGRYAEALEEADRAIALAPQTAETHTARGMALGELGRFDEQEKALARAEKLGASGAGIVHSRANLLVERGDYGGAVAAYEEAVELDPDSWQSHQNLGFLYLKLGDLERGWPAHEWRLKKHNHARVLYEDLAPPWAGEDLVGRRLLVYNEQGHGDTIQFLRFLKPVEEAGAAVTLVAPKALRGFFAENLAGIDVTDKLGFRKDFDFQISLMSLPAVLGTTLATLPADVPYLRPGEDFVAKWAERLGGGGFRIGIVWQGNPDYKADLYRSIPLETYAPLAAVPGVRLISLQVMHGLDQLDRLPPGMTVERLGEEITNNPNGYREVAGVMANLDLVVTSDTGPAHLAGAMARPVWVALRDQPDWRWLMERADSPWYPTMRLFRQTARGDWRALFEEIAAELEKVVPKA